MHLVQHELSNDICIVNVCNMVYMYFYTQRLTLLSQEPNRETLSHAWRFESLTRFVPRSALLFPRFAVRAMHSFSGLPPALREKACNLATWFPEVLAIAGAPEENFSGAQLHVSESSTERMLELVLPKKRPPQELEKPTGQISIHDHRLDNLDRLAADFESLTSQLQNLNRAAAQIQQDRGDRGSGSSTSEPKSNMETRLDAATDELLKLTDILKATPLIEHIEPSATVTHPVAVSTETVETKVPQGPGRILQSPHSARGRGGQAQQGGWSQRNLGAGPAGRSRANKADWKDKLKIEVTKVRAMPEGDPKSPKGKAPIAQVWGKAIPPLHRGETLMPSSVQERIEQKLTMVLGQAARRPERTRTLPASAFQGQIAELSRKKKPASADDLSSSSS